MLRSSERTLVSSSAKSIGLRFQSLHRGLSFAQPSQELVQGPVEVVEGVHRGMKQFSSIDDTKKDLIDIVFRRDWQTQERNRERITSTIKILSTTFK